MQPIGGQGPSEQGRAWLCTLGSVDALLARCEGRARTVGLGGIGAARAVVMVVMVVVRVVMGVMVAHVGGGGAGGGGRHRGRGGSACQWGHWHVAYGLATVARSETLHPGYFVIDYVEGGGTLVEGGGGGSGGGVWP